MISLVTVDKKAKVFRPWMDCTHSLKFLIKVIMQDKLFHYSSILLAFKPELCFDPLIYNILINPFTSFDAIVRSLMNLSFIPEHYNNSKGLHIHILSKLLTFKNAKCSESIEISNDKYAIITKPKSFLGFTWLAIQNKLPKEMLASDLELLKNEFQLIISTVSKLDKSSHAAYSLFAGNEQTFLKSEILKNVYNEYRNNTINDTYNLKVDQSLVDAVCTPIVNFSFKDVYELACLIYFNYNDIVKSIEKSRGISLKHSNQSELNFYLIFNFIAPILYLIYGSTSEFKSELYNKFMVNTNSVPYSEFILG